MNTTVIILGLVLVILVYVLYKYFTVTATTLVPSASLDKSIDPMKSIVGPRNVNYAYGIWLYVNSWDPNAKKNIFHREQNIELFLDPSSPTLKCNIYTSATAKQTVTITDNFPLQKWTCILISMDGPFLDGYLDGKLVVSNKIGSPGPLQPPDQPSGNDTNGAIYLGNSGGAYTSTTPFDAYVTKFNRWTTSLDPQTVWNEYLTGNGKNSFLGMSSTYGVNMTFLQDNVKQGTYALT